MDNISNQNGLNLIGNDENANATPGGQNAGSTFTTLLANANPNQISTWIGQLQGYIAQNPGLAAMIGLGVLVMAMNSSETQVKGKKG